MEMFDYNVPVILTSLLISFIAFILNSLTKGAVNKLLFSSYRSSILNPLTYVRLFTHFLGHKDWNHFMNNFVLILLVGPMVEEKYGSINLLIMILITAFVTGIVNTIIGKYRIMGASGILYMLIVLSSFVNMEAGKIPITLVLIFIFYIINEIKDLFFKKDDVAHFGHLIGAVCGCIYGFYIM